MKKFIKFLFIIFLTIPKMYSFEPPIEESLNLEYKLPNIVFKTQLFTKLLIIKKDLKKLYNLTVNKLVKNFIVTIIEDLDKIKVSDYEQLLGTLEKSSKYLKNFKTLKSLNQNELLAINNIELKINILKNAYVKDIDLNNNEPEEEQKSIENHSQQKINITDIETLTQDNFINLISIQQSKKLPYILAVIETNGNYHYLDAQALNKYIFNNYPIYPNQGKWKLDQKKIMHTNGEFGSKQVENPLNRVNLTLDSIHYFTINKLSDNSFKYLASFKDLIKNENLQKFFYKNDGIIQLKLLHTLIHDATVNSIAISSDGQLIVSGDKAGIAKLWDSESGQLIKNIETYYEINNIKFSSDDLLIAFLSTYSAKIYNTVTKNSYVIKEPINDSSSEEEDPMQEFIQINGNYLPLDKLIEFEFSPNGKRIAYGLQENNKIKVINALTNQLFYSFEDFDCIQLLKISPDSNYILNGVETDGIDYINIRNFATGKKILDDDDNELNLEPEAFQAEISSNSQFVATISPLKIWNLRNAKLLHNLDHVKASLIKISLNNKFIISGSNNGEMKIWDLPNGKLLKTLKHDRPLKSIIISSNNQFFISTGEDSIKIWSLKTGKLLNSILYDTKINSLALSPNDNFIAIAGDNNTVKIWQL